MKYLLIIPVSLFPYFLNHPLNDDWSKKGNPVLNGHLFSSTATEVNYQEFVPESLYAYMYKSYNTFNTAVVALKFKLTSNKIIDDPMAGGKFRTAIYTKGKQEITITSHIPADKNQIEKITSIKSVSPSPLENDNAHMSKEKMEYITETSHVDLLKSYGFVFLGDEYDDGYIRLSKGNAADENYIQCSFICSDQFIIMFENSEND